MANSGANTYFKVPYGWQKIGATSLTNGEKAAGAGAGAWQVAYQAGIKPSGGNFLSFNLNQPFVFAEVGDLSSTEQEAISYDALKDSFLPVSSSAQEQVQEGYAEAKRTDPWVDFKQISDQTLTLAGGVHGVREIFDYTWGPDNITDTFDEIALTNADQTDLYILVLHCKSSCYSSEKTQINDVMSSFTVRSS
ncbi:MAG: hypothetical protein ACRDPY_42170 [Streptosporangiaceae bacterium]